MNRDPRTALSRADFERALRLHFGFDEVSSLRPGLAMGAFEQLWLHAARAAGDRLLIAGEQRAREFARLGSSLGLDSTAFDTRGFGPGFDLELADHLDREGPFDALLLIARDAGQAAPRTDKHSPLLMVTGLLQAFPETLYLVDPRGLWQDERRHASLGCDRYSIDFALCTGEEWGAHPQLAAFASSSAMRERAASRRQALPELEAVLTMLASQPHTAALARELLQCWT